MTQILQLERMRLWSAAYMARLQQGNCVKHIDYMAHRDAIERAEAAIKAFDKRFNTAPANTPSEGQL